MPASLKTPGLKLPDLKVPSLKERKQTLVRDTILEAAIDLFTEKGFDETTVDDISLAAGTSRRSFFRYFESKSDLMAQPIMSYQTALVDAIQNCASGYSPSEVFAQTMLSVATKSSQDPRTRKIMQIAANHPAARNAQIARISEVQEHVAEAFASRSRRSARDRLTARVLAALTLALLGVSFQTWFESGETDISVTVGQVLATLSDVSSERKPVRRSTARS